MVISKASIKSMEREYDRLYDLYPTGEDKIDNQLVITLNLIDECLNYAYTDISKYPKKDSAYMVIVFSDVLQETHGEIQVLRRLLGDNT